MNFEEKQGSELAMTLCFAELDTLDEANHYRLSACMLVGTSMALWLHIFWWGCSLANDTRGVTSWAQKLCWMLWPWPCFLHMHASMMLQLIINYLHCDTHMSALSYWLRSSAANACKCRADHHHHHHHHHGTSSASCWKALAQGLIRKTLCCAMQSLMGVSMQPHTPINKASLPSKECNLHMQLWLLSSWHVHAPFAN